jgi:hypothetical protein
MRAHLRLLSGLAAVGAAVGAATGCIPVQIQTPDKPIEINLNVTIHQDVVVHLQQDAQQFLQQHQDLY